MQSNKCAINQHAMVERLGWYCACRSPCLAPFLDLTPLFWHIFYKFNIFNFLVSWTHLDQLGSILNPFRLPTWLQKSTKTKPNKNWYQDAFPSWPHVLIDSWLISAPKLENLILICRAPTVAKTRLIKNRLSSSTSDFVPMLLPTWLHIPPKYLPKSKEESILKGIIFDRFRNRLFTHWLNLGGQIGAMVALFQP